METVRVHTGAERPIAASDVLRLYRTADWWPQRRADQVADVLDRLPAVGAWRGDRLVGFARAITDGCFHAYLDDVVVDPAERHQRIGTALVRRLTELLRETTPIRTLFCSPELAPFYESVGYRRTRQVVFHHAVDDSLLGAVQGQKVGPAARWALRRARVGGSRRLRTIWGG